MARGDDDLGVLSPYQRIIEDNSLANAYTPSAPAPAPNPLLDSSTGSAIAPTVAAVATPPPGTSNPLVQPSFPLSTMGTDQRLRWQTINQAAQQNQDAINKAAIDAEIRRREDAHAMEVRRQTLELIKHSNELDPSDLKGYSIARTKLQRDYSLAAGSEEVQRALKPLDDVFQKGRELDTQYQKALEAQGRTEQGKRLDDARKQVDELGPDAIADFYQTQKNEGTEAAIEKVATMSGQAKQANIIAQLKNAGLTEDQIQVQYTDPATGKFLYPAAEAAAKVRVNPTLDYNRAVASYSQQLKARKDADYNPNSAEPNPDWTDQQEQIFQGTAAYVNQTGTRAGIQGFDPAKARAEKAEQDKKTADALEAKAKLEEAARAGQPGYFSNLGNAIMGYPAPAGPSAPVTSSAVPSATPASGYPAASPAPASTSRSTSSTSSSGVKINPKTGQKIAWRNGRWVEVQ